MANSGKSRLAALRTEQLAGSVTVGKFSKYEDAQGAVDLLAERGFPVQSLAIVGTDLRQVEHVVGTLSYARVAASGALQGLFYGVVLGLLLTLFGRESPAGAFLTSIPLGVAFWMILAIVGFSRRGGHRSFTAVGQLVAGSYDLVCVAQEAGEARRLLGGSSTRSPLRPTPEEQPYFPPQGHDAGRPPQPRDDRQPAERPEPRRQPWGVSDAPKHDGAAPRPQDQQPHSAEAEKPGASEAPDRSQARDFKDLPDGRPRFGIRAEESAAEPESVEEQGGPDADERRTD